MLKENKQKNKRHHSINNKTNVKLSERIWLWWKYVFQDSDRNYTHKEVQMYSDVEVKFPG